MSEADKSSVEPDKAVGKAIVAPHSRFPFLPCTRRYTSAQIMGLHTIIKKARRKEREMRVLVLCASSSVAWCVVFGASPPLPSPLCFPFYF